MMIVFFIGIITLHSVAFLVFLNNIACMLQEDSYKELKRKFWAMVLITIAIGSRLFYYANHFIDSKNFTINNPPILIANIALVIGVLAYRRNSRFTLFKDLVVDISCTLGIVRSAVNSLKSRVISK